MIDNTPRNDDGTTEFSSVKNGEQEDFVLPRVSNRPSQPYDPKLCQRTNNSFFMKYIRYHKVFFSNFCSYRDDIKKMSVITKDEPVSSFK